MLDDKYLGAYRFGVELEGLEVAGFSEVQGLETETEMEEYREGGLNWYVHKLPKGIRHSRLILRRGLTTSTDLWDWYIESAHGYNTHERKSGSIILYSEIYKNRSRRRGPRLDPADDREVGKEVCRWNFYDAFPVKWTGPSFNALSSDIAIESLELVHNGIFLMMND